MIRILSLIFLIMLSLNLKAQEWHKHTFFEGYNRYKNSGIPTVKTLTDSIRRYSFGTFADLSDEEVDKIDSIISYEVENTLSLEGEFYWNEFHRYVLRNKVGYVGKSLLLLTRNLELAHEFKDTTKLIDLYIDLGHFYHNQSMYDEALEYLWQARDYALATRDTSLIQDCASSISWQLTNIAYAKESNTLQDSAVRYSLIAFDFLQSDHLGYYTEKAFIAALTLARANRRTEAINFSQQCIQAQPEYMHLRERLYPLIFEQYLVLNERDSAFTWANRVYDWSYLYEKEKYPRIVTPDGDEVYVYSLFPLIRSQLKFGEYHKAIPLIEIVLNDTSIKRNHEWFYYNFSEFGKEAFEAVGDYKRTVECQNYIVAFTDSLESIEVENQVIRERKIIEATIYLEQKNAEEFQQQQEITFAAQEKNKRIIFWALGIGLVGLLIFLIVLYRRFKETNRQKRIIEEQKIRVEEAHEEIQDSIAYAKRIQNAILPPPKLVKEYLKESFILYKPKDIVAGDFYWMHTSNNEVLFAAADCTGHGVPGAMVSVICNNGLNRSTREFGLKDPGKILEKTRELVISEFEKSEEEVKDGMDIALCHLSNNTSTGSVSMKYAGANNPLWVIRKDGAEVEEIKGDKQPIGKYADEKPFTSHEVVLNPGDSIYVFSDGFVDQFGGEKGKKFKAKNFKALLLSVQNETMERQKYLIEKAFENWRGNLEQLDDICVIGVRI